MLKALDRLAQRIADFIDMSPAAVAKSKAYDNPADAILSGVRITNTPPPPAKLIIGASVPKHLDLMTSGLKTIGDNIANLERAILKLEEDFEKELVRLKGELASTMSVKRAYTAAHAELDLAMQNNNLRSFSPTSEAQEVANMQARARADGGADITMQHSDIRVGPVSLEELDKLIGKPQAIA